MSCGHGGSRTGPIRIITLGDSITRGVRDGVAGAETFSALLQMALARANPPVEVTNAGVGGERTDQVLLRLDTAVLAVKPAVVTIMYGTNDSYIDPGTTAARLTAEQYRANLLQLLERLDTVGSRPILMTPPCWGRGAQNGLGENPNTRLAPYAEACREVAAHTKTPLADHFAHWTREAAAGKDVGALWTTDQCHPNPAGHRVLFEVLLPVMKKVLKELCQE